MEVPKPRSGRNEHSSKGGGRGGGGEGPSEETPSEDLLEYAVKTAAKDALIESTALVNPALPTTIKLASHAYDMYKLGKRLDNISESSDSDREKMKMMASEILEFGGNKIVDSAIDHAASQMMRTPGMSSTAAIISKQTAVGQIHVETFLKGSMKTGLKVYRKKVQKLGAVR